MMQIIAYQLELRLNAYHMLQNVQLTVVLFSSYSINLDIQSDIKWCVGVPVAGPPKVVWGTLGKTLGLCKTLLGIIVACVLVLMSIQWPCITRLVSKYSRLIMNRSIKYGQVQGGRVHGWESVCRGVLGIPLLENKMLFGFKDSKFHSFRVSNFQSYKVSQFQHFKVSKRKF